MPNETEQQVFPASQRQLEEAVGLAASDPFGFSLELCDLATDTTAVEQWADDVAAASCFNDVECLDSIKYDCPAFFDIETGPRPLEEIECLYECEQYSPPEPLPPFDESMVKYGNAKKEDKRAEIRNKFMADYAARLESEAAEREAHRVAWEKKAAAKKADWYSKAALDATTGRVLLIGVLVGDRPICFGTANEADNLAAFWEFASRQLANRQPMIGHNSNGFDLAFMRQRSWFLGVPVPREVRQGRYWNPLFQDTMEEWFCGQRGMIRLNALGEFFQVGTKTEGVHGKDFSKLWFGTMDREQYGTPAEQRTKALAYNLQDLRLTAAIAKKMEMV